MAEYSQMSQSLREVGDTSECDGTKAAWGCGLGPHSFAQISSLVLLVKIVTARVF